MRVYKKQTLSSLGNFIYYDCPACGDYSTKLKSALLKHYERCDDAFDYIDDSDEHDVSEMDIIEDMDCVIKLVKTFVKTNELEPLSIKEGNDIRNYINDKLNTVIKSKINIKSFTFQIYGIFFEETEEDKNIQEIELKPYYDYILSKL